jgi:uncharacterized membrane protein (DUF4010 family)
MTLPLDEWPYLPTLVRLALALAIGLFVGVERERRGKDSGLRTFGFAALLGGLGGLLGEHYALLSLSLLGVLVVFLNLHTLWTDQSTELTTSAALLVIGFAGVLCGQGHTLTPAALAVITAALLAWKEPLAGFSLGLSEVELRSAILLGILAVVIYPALPPGTVDPWGVVEPRSAWVTVILIAGIGFINYVLWKLYGARGIELTGFLGGLVNSSVAVSALAQRVRDTQGQMWMVAYRGMVLAITAMLLRNAVLLVLLAPVALAAAAAPLLLMLVASLGLAFLHASSRTTPLSAETPVLHLTSPFALTSTLKFGALLLLIQIASALAQRTLGQVGVYGISLVGGLFSSASAVAAAATLAAQGTITPPMAGVCTIIASLASVVVNVPLALAAHARPLMQRLVWAVGVLLVVGALGVAVQLAGGTVAQRLVHVWGSL